MEKAEIEEGLVRLWETEIELLLRFWDTEQIRKFHAAAGQVLIERQREELPPRYIISEE